MPEKNVFKEKPQKVLSMNSTMEGTDIRYNIADVAHQDKDSMKVERLNQAIEVQWFDRTDAKFESNGDTWKRTGIFKYKTNE